MLTNFIHRHKYLLMSLTLFLLAIVPFTVAHQASKNSSSELSTQPSSTLCDECFAVALNVPRLSATTAQHCDECHIEKAATPTLFDDQLNQLRDQIFEFGVMSNSPLKHDERFRQVMDAYWLLQQDAAPDSLLEVALDLMAILKTEAKSGYLRSSLASSVTQQATLNPASSGQVFAHLAFAFLATISTYSLAYIWQLIFVVALCVVYTVNRRAPPHDAVLFVNILNTDSYQRLWRIAQSLFFCQLGQDCDDYAWNNRNNPAQYVGLSSNEIDRR